MDILAAYSVHELFWIALVIFMLGMSKAGLPISTICYPVLVLMWPGSAEPAKNAIAFILPLLCVMDVFAIFAYRKDVLWKEVLYLMPGSVVGVVIGSIFFVSQKKSIITVPDHGLKLLLGIVGFSFVLYQAVKKWILRKLEHKTDPDWLVSSGFGAAAGFLSTLAHAAGPVLQMYLLPRKLDKMNFVGTRAGYFLCLNMIKLLPFSLSGRIDSSKLVLGLWMIPVIPLGVGAGYLVVRWLKPERYIGLIYVVLTIASFTLVWQAVQDF